MEAQPAKSLLSFLAAVPDPRSRRGRRHPLSAILALVCCAVLCGAKSYAAIAQWAQDHDIELMHQLGFTRKPPKLGGIRKVLIALRLERSTVEAYKAGGRGYQTRMAAVLEKHAK